MSVLLHGGDSGPQRDAAAERLHAVLLRAARFEVRRRRPTGGPELDDLAVQAADDALVAVMAKLDIYRGESRLTTWASKFAVLEAAVALRKESWRDRELPPEGAAPSRLPAAAEVLTPYQRAVLVALTLNDVPIDVLAERWATTRGALYEVLHDARRMLRAQLESDGRVSAPG